MKKIILLTTVIAGIASAVPVTMERTLKDTTTIVALELNPTTVFCTDHGYSNIQLKVSVPDLDWLAHFDHRVIGEHFPCITGGQCTDDLKPAILVDPNEPIVLAPMRVVLQELLNIDYEKKTCTRQLSERVSGLIKGLSFNHYRSSDVENVAFEKCAKLSTLP